MSPIKFVAAALLALLMSGAALSAPERIITVDGSVTEIVADLGAQDRIVGVDSTSVWHPSAQGKPVVGYMRALSSEGLLSLTPDLIIATDDAGPPEVLSQVARADVQVKILKNDYSEAGVVSKVHQIGELLHRTEQANTLVAKMKRDFDTVRTNIRQYEKAYRVMFVMDSGERGLMISGQGTRASGVLQMAGLENAFAQVVGYKSLTPEAAIMVNPDVILVFHSELPLSKIKDNAALRLTNAAKAGHIYNVDSLNLLNFGSSIGASIIQLQQRLMAQ